MTHASIHRMASVHRDRLLNKANGARKRYSYISPHVLSSEKKNLLSEIHELGGQEALLSIGSELENVKDDPLLQFAINSFTPEDFFEKWQRFEDFAHSTNRVRIERAIRSARFLRYRVPAGTPESHENLLMCGLFIGFLEAIGCQSLNCSIQMPGHKKPITIWKESAPSKALAHVTSDFSSWQICWTSQSPHQIETEGRDVQRDIETILTADISKKWSLQDIAIKLNRSNRSLQRNLHFQGTSFSNLMRKTRIIKACELLKLPELTVTEIAFLTGFSDTAHFCRTFHQSLAVTPSKFRQKMI